MSDIASELAKLHTLTGADFSRQVERIALRGEFHLVEGETAIYSTGGEQHDDYDNLMSAAHKAVEHGYRVFILPNPKGIRTADFIFERRGLYRIYDLKTIMGKGSIDSRLAESIGQTNRVVLNMTTDYEVGKLARAIKRYFERNAGGVEIVIFKGGKMLSVTRQMATDKDFIIAFAKKYYK